MTASLLAWTSAAASTFVGDPPLPHFTDVAEASGLSFRHDFGGSRVEHILMTTGAGAAMFDYDNDGWLDAFLVNGVPLDDRALVISENADPHALFRNWAGNTFEDATARSGLTETSYGVGVAICDFDGDGYIDLYITNYGANLFYRNLGDGTFEDMTSISGTEGSKWSTGAVFFDYDGDGDLDLYVANYLKFRPGMKGVHASSLSKRRGMHFFPSPRDYEAESDVLYRNNGDARGTFTDVSDEAGLVEGGKGFTPVAIDFDEDGDQDLFVANDSTANFLYRNDGGHFTEIGLESGAAYDPQGVETGAMGVDVADIDGDGLQDLYVTNYIFEHNNLYRNLGNLTFVDVTKSVGLDRDNYRHVGWATRLADFNNDGFLDCFVANGHLADYVEGFSEGVTYRQRNMLFLGNSTGRFENVSGKVGKDFRSKQVSRGAAFGDYDNDGDIDILISNSGGNAQLLRNDLPPNDRWIKIRLIGKPSNRRAIGAKVRVQMGEETVSKVVRVPDTYVSASEPTLHLGLRPGVREGIVEVTWPSGTQSRKRFQSGRLVLIREGTGGG